MPRIVGSRVDYSTLAAASTQHCKTSPGSRQLWLWLLCWGAGDRQQQKGCSGGKGAVRRVLQEKLIGYHKVLRAWVNGSTHMYGYESRRPKSGVHNSAIERLVLRRDAEVEIPYGSSLRHGRDASMSPHR
ncbi:unnamed protein product [Caretta caretta]